MKMLVAVLVITVVTLGVVSGFLFNQNSELQNLNSELSTQNSEIQNQLDEKQNYNSELENETLELQKQIDELQQIVDTPKAKFLSFSSPEGWWNPVGVTMAIRFDVIIVNVGPCDIEDAIVEISWNNSEGDSFNRTRTFDMLESGEMAEFHEDLIISMDTYFAEFYHSNFRATISSGNRILDESMLEITQRQF